MSNLSDSENEALSGNADITGSSSSISSTSSSSTRNNGPEGPNTRPLVEYFRYTCPDCRFIEDLHGVAQAQPAPVVDLTTDVGDVPEKAASQANTSGREDSQGSESSASFGEPIQARQRPPSRAMRINDQRVYRRADQEMVGLAGGRPVYSVDYFTSAVTPRYLAAFKEEFRIPDDVDLVVLSKNDIPSSPPPGYITLSAEYFRAGLRLPFHPYLRRALHRLNVAPAAFQNLYRMKSAPSSSGFHYFQGFKGTFITRCPDFDKQFKHMWFYAGGRWLHEHLAYADVPPSERVPLVFRRGYVWTRAPHIPDMTLVRVEALRELSDPERNQQGLLSLSSLAEHNWFGSSSTSGRINDQPRTSRLEAVTIARLSESAVHYRSRTGDNDATVAPDRSRVPRGVPVAMVHDLPSGDPSPGAWGPWIADEDVHLVIRELFPAWGLRIKEPMADRERRGTKRLSGEDGIARLQKMAKIGKGKGKSRTSDPPSRLVVPSTAPATRAVVPPTVPAPQAALPPAPRPTDRSKQKSAHKALVSKFGDKLTLEVVGSSIRSDPVVAFSDCAKKLIEGLCLVFSGSAAARGYANRMADEMKAAEAEARHARQAEKDANAARDTAREAQKRGNFGRSPLRIGRSPSRSGLGSPRRTPPMPRSLDAKARAQAVKDFLQSEDFNSRLVAEYQEGMRDMKAGFTKANPLLVGVDWFFVPTESEETAAEEVPEEGEVSGAARAPEDLVVLDDPEEPATPKQPVVSEQPIVPEQPTSKQLDFSLPD
ncbi:hypothetical protein TIFTF001_009036 [Ficus carica]|uniref:Uncharacterized protein n=1 Tax=Ficus carica TaxID=3494 RepID=A0AA88D287_FICCA|nr:hypothetical protein TIFTF001_009036 [Ficus carica]